MNDCYISRSITQNRACKLHKIAISTEQGLFNTQPPRDLMRLEPPLASSPNARATMKANKGKNTKPELKVRRMLRESGHPGYRLQWKIKDAQGKVVCRPDIAYPGRKVAIFVHGCFWHRCPHCDLSMPKKNRDYWLAKFEDNVARDRLKEVRLRNLGWKVHTIWECRIEHALHGRLRATFVGG